MKIIDLANLTLTGPTVSATPSTAMSALYDTSGNGGRKIVRLSNGWIVTCAYSSSDTSIYYFVSTNGGVNWSKLCYHGAANYKSYAIASTGTTIYAVMTNAGSSTTVYCFAFDATTVSSSSAISYKSTFGGVAGTIFGDGVSLTLDGTGALLAAWCSKDNTFSNSYNIHYSKSTDGGTTWAAQTQITNVNTSGDNYQRPCISVDSSNNPIIMMDYAGPTYGIYKSVWTGSAWSLGPGPIYNDSYTHSNSCFVVDSSDVIHVVWHGKDATNTTHPQIKYSKSTDKGATWSAVVTLTSNASYDQFNASITIDSRGRLRVLWNGVDTSVSAHNNIWQLICDNGTWSSATNLTSNSVADALYPQTLWSKFNMNSDDAVRYTFQDSQWVAIRYDQSPRFSVPAPQPISEVRIPLWVSDGTYLSSGTSNTAAGTKFVQEGTTTVASSPVTLFSLSSTFSTDQQFAFEAVIAVSGSGNTAEIALWDVTTNQIVSNCTLTTTSTTMSIFRSGTFTLIPGHNYGITVWNTTSTQATYVAESTLVAVA